MHWAQDFFIDNGKLFHSFPPEYIKLHLSQAQSTDAQLANETTHFEDHWAQKPGTILMHN